MRMSLGTVADRDLELARLAAVDAWYDQMLQAAKRVDPSATMSKHDTLATLSVGGRSFLLTGVGWSGAQQTGATPDQLIASYLVSSDVSEPAYVPAPDIAAVALISDLGQNKPGVPIANSPADQPRIDQYYRTMSALQDSGFSSVYYPAEYPPQFAPHRAAVVPKTSTGGTAQNSVQSSILQTAADQDATVGTSGSSVQSSVLQTATDTVAAATTDAASTSSLSSIPTWVWLAGAAAALYYFMGRSK